MSQFDRFSLLGKELKWERNVRKCGGKLPFVSFGQCGMKEIEWPLITRPSMRTDLRVLSFVIFGLGLTCLVGTETGVCWIFLRGWGMDDFLGLVGFPGLFGSFSGAVFL